MGVQDTEVRVWHTPPADADTVPDDMVWHNCRYSAETIAGIFPKAVRIEWFYIGDDDDCEIPVAFAVLADGKWTETEL